MADTTSATELERLVVRLMGESSQYDKIMDGAEAKIHHAVQTLEAAAAEIEAKQDEMLQDAARLFASTRTPMERYASEVDRLSVMHQQGYISANMFNRAVREMHSQLPHVVAAQERVRLEQQRVNDVMRQAKGVFDSVRTPAEIYRQKLGELNKLQQEGVLSTQTYARAMRQLDYEYGAFGKRMETVGQQMRSVGMKMTIGITAPIVAMGVASSREFTRFEDGLLNIKAAANPTEAEMAKLEATAMRLSADLKMDPTPILAGYTELMKAGVSLDKVLGSTGEQALKFAKVGELETSTAAVVMADAMTVFNETAEDTGNILSGAADASSVSIRQITEAFSQVSAVGGQANQSLTDVAAGIALLGKYGVKGSDAGTSLKTMFLRLQAPVDKAKKVFEDYHLEVRNADKSMKPLVEIVAELEKKFGHLDQVTKDRVLSDLFGQDAIRAGSIFLKAGAKGVSEFTAEIVKAQSVSEKYDTIMSGQSGTIAELGASYARLKISIGESISKVLGPFYGWMSRILSSIGEWASNNKEVAGALAMVAAAAAIVGPALMTTGAVLTILPSMVAGYKLLNTTLAVTKFLAAGTHIAMAALAVGGMYLLAKAVHSSLPWVRAQNDELERSKRLATELNEIMDKRAQGVLDEANREQDPAKRTEQLAAALKMAKVEVEGVEQNLASATRELTRMEEEFSFYGNFNIDSQKQQVEELTNRLAQQKTGVEALDKAYKDAAAGAEFEAKMKLENPALEMPGTDDLDADVTPLQKYIATQAELKKKLDASTITLKEFKRRMREAKTEFNSKDTDPVRALTDDLEQQVAMFGMTSEAQRIYKMEQLGATEAQLAEANALQSKLDVMEKEKKSLDKATELAEKYVTPQEKFAKIQKELTDLYDRELISLEAFNQEMKVAREDLTKGIQINFQVTGVEAVLAGSREALAAVEATRAWMKSDQFTEALQASEETYAARFNATPAAEPRFDANEKVNAVAKANNPRVKSSHDLAEKWLEEIAVNTRDKKDKIVLESAELGG